MHRIQSRHSVMSEIEMDGLAEQELEKLQRQYRVMDGERRAYCEESQNVIRKQQDQIAQLDEEIRELQKELDLAESKQNSQKDNKNTDSLVKLLEKQNTLKQQHDEEKRLIQDLNKQIKQMEQAKSRERQTMGGTNMQQQVQVQLGKQIRVMENRLDKKTTQFNNFLAKNAKLRDEIDHARKVRTIFEGEYKKLEGNLAELKKEMGEIIETSSTAYDARDEAQSKMIALKEKADKDLLQYNMELKELIRIIDHDRKLKEFMRVKGEERADLADKELGMKQRKRETERDKGDREETVESYEEAFEKLKEATEIEDIDLLVSKFIEVEDRNFALFNYVNELNNDIEMLQEQINLVQDDIDQFKSEGVDVEEERKAILRRLEDDLNKASKTCEEYDDGYKGTHKIIEQLKDGVDSLFKKINCDKSAISDMLGGVAGVTEGNMMQYLGIIEQRTNELLQTSAYKNAKETDRPDLGPVGLLGGGPQIAAGSVAIVPPTTGDDYETEGSTEESEDECRPMTAQELKSKIMKSINRREAQPKKSSPPLSARSDDKGLNKRKKK